jgi:hypothetical protein
MADDMVEKLAKYLHDLWANWFKRQHKTEIDNEQSSGDDYHIAEENLTRWLRQADTPYEDLSEEDKEKDRKIANEIFWLMNDG